MPSPFAVVGCPPIAGVFIAATLLVAVTAPAGAQVLPVPAAQSDACDADDDDGKPVPFWKRFAWEGACVDISGDASVVYQKQKDNDGAPSIPMLTTRRGVVTDASEMTTLSGSYRIDTTRKAAAGTLTTGIEVKYQRASTDTGNGSITLTEAIVAFEAAKGLGTVKGGYTDSQVNYWSGDFQFSATAPQRTVGLAGYAFKLSDEWSFTLAYETGLPETRAAEAPKFAEVFPTDPVASAKLYYEKDDASFQLAGLVHQLTLDGNNPRLAALNRSGTQKELGWVATMGLTLPVKLGKEGSAFSMQTSYAVNASPYLGTVVDASSLASLISVPVTSKGWSIVGSYHHVFSDHWEANAMASYLALDFSVPLGTPSIASSRFAANLIFKPVESLKLGAEVGYVAAEFDNGGVPGFFDFEFFNRRGRRVASLFNPAIPTSGATALRATGLAGYLFATWSF